MDLESRDRVKGVSERKFERPLMFSERDSDSTVKSRVSIGETPTLDLLPNCFLEKIAIDCCESNLLTLPPPVPSHGGHHRPWWRHHFTQWWSWFDPTRLRPATPARLKTSTRYPGTQGRRVDPRLALSPIAHPSMCHTYIIAHSEVV